MQVITHFLKWRLGLAEAETQTTCAERDAIARYAAGKRFLVEIGVWHGVTTKRMRAAMAPDGVLLAIDPFPFGRLGVNFQQFIAHAEVRKVHHGEVKWIRQVGAGAFKAAQAEGPLEVDFLFIDGDHSFDGLREDWELWSPMVAPNGIVSLHDSRSTSTRDLENAGSAIYTRQYILPDVRFDLVENVDSLTVLRRLPSVG